MPAQLNPAMTWARAFACLCVLVGASACGSSGPACASGTHVSGNACVADGPAPVCGAGTVQEGSVCVPVDGGSTADATGDASGTDDAQADTGATDIDTAADLPDSATSCLTPCAKGYVCSALGTCEPDQVTVTWTCLPVAKGDGATCDCNCGEPDPDCADASLPVAGCGLGGACKADGTCATCVASCSGKQCGSDGCGGSCGTCLDPTKLYCSKTGQCIAACLPACSGLDCGDDGCGGSCGACTGSKLCQSGHCTALPPELSCVNQCGGLATGGCSCEKGCKNAGTCCGDVDFACACLPDCSGKQCGSDGCGGFCGDCAEGLYCDVGQCAVDLCHPDPCAGNGSCSQVDGSCTCDSKFTGKQCNACAAGLVDYPKCTPDQCAGKTGTCSGHGACQAIDGSCVCDTGFAGASCGACVLAGATWPACTDPCAGKVCTDDNPCTNDTCDATGACKFIANSLPCDDGDPCTQNDTCSTGGCYGTVSCTIAVNSSDDVDDGTCDGSHCSLREAILLANSNLDASSIGFTKDLTITPASALPTIKAPVSIVGNGHAVILDGGGAQILLAQNAGLTLRNLTVRKGSAAQGGAVQVTGGQFTAQRVRFLDNASSKDGGAVYVDGPADVSECHFQGNTATGKGGAIDLAAGNTLTVNRSSFDGNSAGSGGAIATGGTLNVVNSSFIKNSASSSGGAIVAQEATILQCSLWSDSPVAVPDVAVPTLHLGNSVIAGLASLGNLCSASTVDAIGTWIADGSCSANLSGVVTGLSVVNTTFGEILSVASGSGLIDAGNIGACGTSSVAGVDQIQTPRPQGMACDIGAMEVLP